MKNIYIALAAAGILVLSFWFGMSYQKNLTQISADKQEIAELEDVGKIKAGDKAHENDLQKDLQNIDEATDAVLGMRLPDNIIDSLGGVYKPTS